MSTPDVAADQPVFRALADPTRRRLLDELRRGPRTTGELVAAHPEMTRYGVMAHLAVLEQAGLVVVTRQGRHRTNHLNPVPIAEIHQRWMHPYARTTANELLALKRNVERKERRTVVDDARTPIAVEIAQAIRPKTSQNCPQSRSPLIVMAIPIASTTNEAGTKIRVAPHSAWRATSISRPGSSARSVAIAMKVRNAPPPIQRTAETTWTPLKARYQESDSRMKTSAPRMSTPAATAVIVVEARRFSSERAPT